MRFLHLVVRNAARNKRRTALTVLSLAVSLFLYVFFDTVFTNWTQSSEQVPESARRLIVRNISMANFLPESHGKLLRDVPGVAVHAPWAWFSGRLRDRPKDFFSTLAVELDTFGAVWGEYKIPPTTFVEWQGQRQGAIVGQRLLTKYGWTKGSRFVLTSDIYNGCEPELVVVGSYTGGQDEETLFFDRRYLGELARDGPFAGQTFAFYVVVKDVKDLARVSETIDAQTRGSTAPTKTETEKDFILGFMSVLGDVRGLVMKVTFVVLGVVFLVVMNTMAMSVRERTREVAVMKALGFSPSLVVRLVIAEGVVTAFAGGLIGCVGTRILFENVLARPTVFVYFTNFSPAWPTVLTGLGISLLIGFFSSVWPAWRASRIEVVAGLRRIG